MMFREHKPGIVTLPEPIDWMANPSTLREYHSPRAATHN